MEIFKTDFKCDFCNKKVDASKDYVKIIFIKKGTEGKKKYRFCSLLCIEKWLISQDTNLTEVNLNNLEEGVINEENKINKNEDEIIENQNKTKNDTKKEKKEGTKKIKDKSYEFENKYTRNLKYDEKDIKKNQENILIKNIDPDLKKIKMIEKKDEYMFVEEDTIKKKLKYHFGPKTFFEKMKDRLKIHFMIDYDDEK